MTQASHKAHEKIKEREESLKAKILFHIRKNNLTVDQLCSILYAKYSTITARVSDLYDEGLIKPGAPCNGQTEWAISQDHEIESIKAQRRAEKKQKAVRNVLAFADDMPQDLREQLKQMAA